jgi:serine/threonine protein kinase
VQDAAPDITLFPGLNKAAIVKRDRLGPYRLLEQIGFGGMSQVYLAERDDEHFKHQVAIKVIAAEPDTEDIVRRFRTERQILADLDHPHIVHIYDGGTTDDGRMYFVLEYVDGMAIDLYARQSELGVKERLELFLTVCSAVGYTHHNLIVHRDLKPGNILVTQDGVPKLLDFGIAKILRQTGSPSVEDTDAGREPMTLQYASPEQMSGEAVTTATDVYALGLLLYELLTERRPYEVRGLSPAEVRHLVCESLPIKPSLIPSAQSTPFVRPSRLAGDLDNIVMTAIAKETQRRYATVEQLAEDVRRHLTGRPLAIARPSGWGYRFSKLVRRNSVAASVAAVSVVVWILLGVMLVARDARLAHQLDQVRIESEHLRRQLAAVYLEQGEDDLAQGEPENARESWSRALAVIEPLALDSEAAEVLDLYAEVLVHLGRVDEAKAVVERRDTVRE